MKITPTTDLLSSINPKLPKQNPPDLPKKPFNSRRKTPRKAGPPTQLLRWKFDDGRGVKAETNAGEESLRKSRTRETGVSARKLAAALWRLQAAEDGGADEEDPRKSRRKTGDPVSFKPDVGGGGGGDHASRECGSEAKDPVRSPCSVNGPVNAYFCERQSPFQFCNYAMEGATKWDPVYASDENSEDSKLVDKKLKADSVIVAFESELEQARVRIQELEMDRRSQKQKVEHFLKKLSEERAAWRSREHEKVRTIIEDVKTDLSRERKNRQTLENVNSKLVNELAEAKFTAKRYMQDYEKEKKARVLIEEVCDELAKEIGEDKAEVDELKNECIKIREEANDERKMLQMAEVWREERVQMKLLDAKVVLDQKYSEMSWLVAELEKFLRSKGENPDFSEVRKAEFLRRAVGSVNVEDLKEFTYEPSNSGDTEFEQCIVSNVDDDASGWETVSRGEDQGSSCSPEGSVRLRRDSNVSGSFFTEWEDETPVIEVCSVPPKKANPVSRLWPTEMGGWSPPDSKNNNPHVTRGMKKGCIEWPRGGAQKSSSLKHNKLIQAKTETQKIQLRHVLKQKI